MVIKNICAKTKTVEIFIAECFSVAKGNYIQSPRKESMDTWFRKDKSNQTISFKVGMCQTVLTNLRFFLSARGLAPQSSEIKTVVGRPGRTSKIPRQAESRCKISVILRALHASVVVILSLAKDHHIGTYDT
jgi:hypothetical protein